MDILWVFEMKKKWMDFRNETLQVIPAAINSLQTAAESAVLDIEEFSLGIRKLMSLKYKFEAINYRQI